MQWLVISTLINLDVAEGAGADQLLRRGRVGGVVPRPAEQEVNPLALRQGHQLARLGCRDGHRLLDQHMQAALQRRRGLPVVDVGRGTDHHRVERFAVEGLLQRGGGSGDGEVGGDALRHRPLAVVYAAHIRPRVTQQCRDVRGGAPPAGARSPRNESVSACGTE